MQIMPVESREEDVSSAMGLLQALVSVFADDGDRIRLVFIRPERFVDRTEAARI